LIRGRQLAVSHREAARRIESLSTALRVAGLRLTQQRLEVLREIAGTEDHPGVETIYGRVRERVPTISLDTVYRSLGALADLGLVRRVTTAGGPVRYDANLSRHHHFVCTRCGLVRDVESAQPDGWEPAAEALLPGTVESIEVHLMGMCAGCRRRESAPAGGKGPHLAPSSRNGTPHRREPRHG
jgi:Fur family transcriptional regulator, peroxide stress response regulator